MTSNATQSPPFRDSDATALSRSCPARVWSCWCGTTLHRRDDLAERAWLPRITDHTHHCKEARA